MPILSSKVAIDYVNSTAGIVCCCFTSKIISRWVSACESAHRWRLYSGKPGHQAPMAWCPTLSHYPHTQPTSPCPTLIMPSTWLGKSKELILKSLDWLDLVLNPQGSDSPISQSGRGPLYSFSQPVWSGYSIKRKYSKIYLSYWIWDRL